MSAEWQTVRIGDLGKVITGKTPSTAISENFGGDYPFITIPDLDDRREITASARTLSELGAQAMRSCRLPRDAVLMSCIATIGKCGITTRVSFTNQQINSLICKDGVDPKFVYYSFTQLGQALEAAGGGGSVYTNVSKSRFEAIEIKLPSLKEQKSVAAMLSKLDDKININRSINQTLEAMAQAIFKSWFVDFDPVKAKISAKQEGRDPLRAAMIAISGKPEAELAALPPEQYAQLAATAALFPDEMEASELGEIPRGWAVGSLSDFASFQNGYAFKTKDWTDSGHPVVKIGNVKPVVIDLSGCSFVAHETVEGLKRFSLKRGDLLVGMTGYVGETGLVPALDTVAYLNQRVGCISTPNGINDIGYSFCLVRDPAYKTYAESKAHGSAQANVSGKNLMDYVVVVPDIEILRILNTQMAKIIKALLSYHEESRSLAALRDTLLPKLLSGELSVTEAMAEVEA